MKGQKLRLLTNDGKIFDIPVKILSKLILFGNIELKVNEKQNGKEILLIKITKKEK